MAQYSFRTALPSDGEKIIDFMNANWGSRHPLVNDSRLFSYYFHRNDNLNFALCFADDKLVAVAGFIYANSMRSSAFVSIWCADKKYNGAGLELMERLKDLVGVDVLCCNNIRPNTLRFYEFLGYHTGRFKHAYLLSKDKEFKIAEINNPVIIEPQPSDAVLIETDYIAQETLDKITEKLAIKKDIGYLDFRYKKYPFKSYRYFTLYEQDEIYGIFILRVTEVENSRAIRLVDYIGTVEHISKAGVALRKLLSDLDCEYLDFYCAGIDDNILNYAGFSVRDDDDKNIIPNYTEPLDRVNVDFYYFTSSIENFTMFRSDGDGDRPILEPITD